MKKKIALIQMQAVLAGVETNYRHAEELMEQAMEGNPDILVLPETWNTGFYISRKLKSIADEGGKRTDFHRIYNSTIFRCQRRSCLLYTSDAADD